MTDYIRNCGECAIQDTESALEGSSGVTFCTAFGVRVPLKSAACGLFKPLASQAAPVEPQANHACNCYNCEAGAADDEVFGTEKFNTSCKIIKNLQEMIQRQARDICNLAEANVLLEAEKSSTDDFLKAACAATQSASALVEFLEMENSRLNTIIRRLSDERKKILFLINC